MKKLAPNALWWFRWAAFFTFLTGLILFYQITARIGTEILLGAVMGTLMMLNVWGIIWRNQKIVLGMKEGDAAAAGETLVKVVPGGEIEAKIGNTPVPHYTTALRPADWSLDTDFLQYLREAASRGTAKIRVSTD